MRKQTLSSPTFIILGIIFILGVAVRLVPVITLEYPLNDGGLFTQFVNDLIANQFVLPKYTTYNQANIPFAYPPLSFYLDAILTKILSVSAIQTVRLVPAILSLLTLPAFFLLAKALLPVEESIFALAAFSLMPTAFDWLIVGGGLSRAPAFLFAILSLYFTVQFLRSPSWRDIIMSAFLAGLTLLSHPGVSWFLVYSSVLFVLYHRGWKKELRYRVIAWVGLIVLISAFWWLPVILEHGYQTLLYPFQTEAFSAISFLVPFTFLFTNEPLITIWAIAGLFGIIVHLQLKRYLILGWLLVVFILEPRLSATYATLPFALLAGSGAYDAVQHLIFSSLEVNKSHLIKNIFISFILIYASIAAYIAIDYQSITPAAQELMEWAEQNSTPTASYAVISGEKSYGTDTISEWFPVIAQQHSLATPQGYEWLPDEAFTRRAEAHADLQICWMQQNKCLQDWQDEYRLPMTHVLITSQSGLSYKTSILWLSMNNDPQYELRFANDEGAIFEMIKN